MCWVASCPGKYITELDARTGQLVRIISGPKYRFDCPVGFAVVGRRLWVADSYYPSNNHRSELNPQTGALVRVTRGTFFPDSLVARAGGYVYLGLGVSFAVFGYHVWSSSPGSGETPGNGVQEYDAGNGRLVRTVTRHVSTNAQVLGLTGRDLWIGSDNSAVTELDAKTGAVVRVLSGFTPFMSAGAVSGGHIWLLEVGGGVTEIDTKTGAVVRVIAAPRYGLSSNDIAVANGRVWETNGDASSVTEFDASTGAVIRVMSNRK